MEGIMDFFNHITTVLKMLWVLGCLLLAWGLEALLPLFRHPYNKWKHVGTNLLFFSFTAVLNVLIGMVFVGLFLWIENSRIGILGVLSAPLWLELLISILALDLFS